MVPNEMVEQALIEAYGRLDAEAPMLAVGARPDAAKDEVRVLLGAMKIAVDDMLAKLTPAGLANLWIPKEIIRVEAIPTLATGKLDLKAIREIAAKSA